MIRELTCIVCPKGCQLKAELEGGKVVNVTGHTCPRTITSTARTENGQVIPVKTSTTVPKELMFDCMREINRAVVKLPARIGDVLIENILGTGANVVVTANMDE